MKFNYHKQLFIKGKVGGGFFRKPSTRYLYFALLTVVFIIKLTGCEDNNRFYRPDLPEKLCSIGIIDADDTTRYISFEKSYQIEYPNELSDSLRGFSFSISSSLGDEIFSYSSDTTIKELRNFKIPDNIEFLPGETYFLNAKEDSTPSITAEITVPEPPSEPSLISINKETITLSEPENCLGDTIAKSVTISFSFTKGDKQNQYYALLMECKGFTYSSSYIPNNGFLDFSVRDCNSPGFLAIMQGLNVLNYICKYNAVVVEKFPVHAYFIEGDKIPENECIITLSTQFGDSYSVYEWVKSIRIKLLSIPETLYLFEKSLYTYGKVAEDPFTEPVYLNGNIKGGNGVFSICRSSELIIDLSPWY